MHGEADPCSTLSSPWHTSGSHANEKQLKACLNLTHFSHSFKRLVGLGLLSGRKSPYLPCLTNKSLPENPSSGGTAVAVPELDFLSHPMLVLLIRFARFAGCGHTTCLHHCALPAAEDETAHGGFSEGPQGQYK